MLFHTIRKQNPLIHCITNYVVANFQANGLLAIGASPVMADDSHEVEEMVAIASGLLINIGTLNKRMKESMLLAGKSKCSWHSRCFRSCCCRYNNLPETNGTTITQGNKFYCYSL